MKKQILLITASVILFCSFVKTVIELRTASVEQIEGLSIYYLAKPTDAFTTLGNYKIKIASSNDPETLLNKLVKKIKETYPTAQGIVIAKDMGSCDAISFNK